MRLPNPLVRRTPWQTAQLTLGVVVPQIGYFGSFPTTSSGIRRPPRGLMSSLPRGVRRRGIGSLIGNSLGSPSAPAVLSALLGTSLAVTSGAHGRAVQGAVLRRVDHPR